MTGQEKDGSPSSTEKCLTCDGTRRRQVDQFGNVWGNKLAEAMPSIIVGDIPCPSCSSPENVDTPRVSQ